MRPELVPIVASTHYGDFKGTVSIDQADFSEVLRLLEQKVTVPDGYRLVGFSIDAWGRNPGRGHFWHLTVYSVDVQSLAGRVLTDYASEHDHIPVFECHASIEAAEVAALLVEGVKEFSMVAATRELERKPMVKLDNN